MNRLEYEKKRQHEKHQIWKKVFHGKSAKNCSTKKEQHEKSSVWKECDMIVKHGHITQE